MSGARVRPRVPWGGPDGVQRMLSRRQKVRRVIGTVLVVFNPLAALFGLVFAWVLTRELVMRRLPGWAAVVAAVGATLIVLWVVGSEVYLRPLREIAAVGVQQGGTRGVGPAVVELAGRRWASWLSGQFPLAVMLGLSYGAIYMARRRMYRPTYRLESARSMTHLQGRAGVKAHARAVKDLVPLAPGQPWQDSALFLGIRPDGERVEIPGKALLAHVVTTGPTGQGKTTTFLRVCEGWLVQWRASRLPLVVIDFKADPELVKALRGMAAATGRKCQVVRLRGNSATYNTLRHGDGDEVFSRVMETLANAASGGFSEAHYRAASERWLRACCLALVDLAGRGVAKPDGSGPWQQTLADLTRLMWLPTLRAVRAHLRGHAAELVTVVLSEIDANSKSQLGQTAEGIRTRVANSVEGGAGRRILIEAADGVDLEASIRGGDVLVFSLAAAQNAADARIIGDYLLRDLARVFAHLEETGWEDTTGRRCLVLLDEFGALGGANLTDCVERGRSGGGTFVLSAQNDGAFTEVSDEFSTKVWDNANVWLLHKQRSSAEQRAKELGTDSGWGETVQVTEDTDAMGRTVAGSGVGSLREVERFRVHPSELKDLSRGQLVLAIADPKGMYRVAVTKVRDWAAYAPHDRQDEPNRATPGEPKKPAVPTPEAPEEAPERSDNEDPWSSGDQDPWLSGDEDPWFRGADL